MELSGIELRTNIVLEIQNRVVLRSHDSKHKPSIGPQTVISFLQCQISQLMQWFLHTLFCCLAASAISFKRPSLITLAMSMDIAWLNAPPLFKYPLNTGKVAHNTESKVYGGEERGGGRGGEGRGGEGRGGEGRGGEGRRTQYE